MQEHLRKSAPEKLPDIAKDASIPEELAGNLAHLSDNFWKMLEVDSVELSCNCLGEVGHLW